MAHGSCWTWIDELYFAVITFSTIGYGDVTPHTKGGKAMATFLVRRLATVRALVCSRALARVRSRAERLLITSSHRHAHPRLARPQVAMGIFSFTTVLGAYHNITMAKKMGAEKT